MYGAERGVSNKSGKIFIGTLERDAQRVRVESDAAERVRGRRRRDRFRRATRDASRLVLRATLC